MLSLSCQNNFLSSIQAFKESVEAGVGNAVEGTLRPFQDAADQFQSAIDETTQGALGEVESLTEGMKNSVSEATGGAFDETLRSFGADPGEVGACDASELEVLAAPAPGDSPECETEGCVGKGACLLREADESFTCEVCRRPPAPHIGRRLTMSPRLAIFAGGPRLLHQR